MAARGLVLLLLALVVALQPLALASPPDPTWISGLYDDGDYDDVVILITAAPGAPPSVVVRCVDAHWQDVAAVAVADDERPPVVTIARQPSRGPPLA